MRRSECELERRKKCAGGDLGVFGIFKKTPGDPEGGQDESSAARTLQTKRREHVAFDVATQGPTRAGMAKSGKRHRKTSGIKSELATTVMTITGPGRMVLHESQSARRRDRALGDSVYLVSSARISRRLLTNRISN